MSRTTVVSVSHSFQTANYRGERHVGRYELVQYSTDAFSS